MGIFEALACWIRWLAGTMRKVIVESVEFVLDAILGAVNVVLGLLPQDPTGGIPDDGIVNNALDWANYLLPIGPLFAEFTLIMTAWILYRLYQWLLGFAKADV